MIERTGALQAIPLLASVLFVVILKVPEGPEGSFFAIDGWIGLESQGDCLVQKGLILLDFHHLVDLALQHFFRCFDLRVQCVESCHGAS